MRLENLNREEIRRVYEERMKEDFPPNELKPLSMLYDGLDQGRYICFGLKEKENIIGYCYLLKNGDDYLIDYLAIYPDRRNHGLGGKTLESVSDYLAKEGARSIIGEVENPEFATSEEERHLQTRRFGFYMRNGFRDTGVKVECFKAHFIMIETGKDLVHSKEEIRELYAMHLKSILTKEKFEENVFI